jgi:hypothetical protein
MYNKIVSNGDGNAIISTVLQLLGDRWRHRHRGIKSLWPPIYRE